MEEFYNSDPTMIASNLFNKLVNDVRNSGLNFRMELTPFGAKISLKKSLMKNQDGNIVIPGPSPNAEAFVEDTCLKNTLLERQIVSLKLEMNETVEELLEAQNRIKILQEEVHKPEHKYSQSQVDKSISEKEKLKFDEDRDNEEMLISDKTCCSVGTESLHVPVVPQPLASSSLKKKLIHPWNQIPLNRPEMSSNGSCVHSAQCVVRQPRNQPLPSITFLKHDVSKYDLHMMTRSSFHGCIRCFSVDNENYGCDDCTWLIWWFKWHGLRHGFPDIHPTVYKRYV